MASEFAVRRFSTGHRSRNFRSLASRPIVFSHSHTVAIFQPSRDFLRADAGRRFVVVAVRRKVDDEIRHEIGIMFVAIPFRIANYARAADRVVEAVVGMTMNPEGRLMPQN
jgi:hypothetical protein